MPTKMSATCSCRREIGCRAPTRARGGERRDVDALGLEPRGGLGRGELLLARGERLGHASAGLADELAELGLALGCDIAQPRVQPRERRALRGVRGAGGLERGGVGCGADGVERGLDRGIHRLGRDFG